VTSAAARDAIVVGAGPAGSAAAAFLAGRGRRVLLLEKDAHIRPKVCGALLSAAAMPSLERLGVRDAVEAIGERVDHGLLHLPRGRPVAFDLPAPALGISRAVLDEILVRRARTLGARSVFGARVVWAGRWPDGRMRVRCRYDGSESELAANGVIGAWGRWDALDRSMRRDFLGDSDRFFGWSRDYAGDAAWLEGEVRLYVFPGGYCGLSPVEKGGVNFAGVVSGRAWRGASGGWEGVVERARGANAWLDRDLALLEPGPAGFRAAGPVFFAEKAAVENGILLAGDAAGVIDPFSGEGQAAALASGLLAAETLERGLSGEIAGEGAAAAYATAWRARFGSRFAWSAALRRLMLHPAAGSLAARVCGERLARFAVSRLSERPAAPAV
jgi:flavin-dependent dehydrogenase